MNSNNKKRLLKLIDILTRHSDMNNPLTLNEIMEYIEAEDIQILNRKTLYDDLKTLESFGYSVERINNSYYLSENPFTQSEIKVILDSLHSLKNIDQSILQKLDKKLYSFISVEEEKLLRTLEYTNRHTDDKFIPRLEDVLYSIDNQVMMNITDKKGKESIIGPCFLYRENNYYYLYYHYQDSDKLYKTRFDNIRSTALTDIKDTVSIPKNRIMEYISSGTNAYNKGKVETICFEIINPSPALNNRLMDDFSTYVATKNGFSIKSSINDAFFAKLYAYGDDIKISDHNIADLYIKYLNRIITRNK